MEILLERIELAKNNNSELECLISDYIPFIKKAVNETGLFGIEYDDRLSIAMLTFMNCVKQYEFGRGNFMAFAASCIRNRLIDESRRQMRYAVKVIPLYQDDDETNTSVEDRIHIAAYNLEQEHQSLSDEIDILTGQLGDYGISFSELPRICPKQERSRKKCIEIGRFVAGNEKMHEILHCYRRLAQSELAKKFGVSEKTIEKHRKYIVTIAILVTGDYPQISAFLPRYSPAKNCQAKKRKILKSVKRKISATNKTFCNNKKPDFIADLN